MQSLKRLELDPDGDIELVLKKPNAQLLQWPPGDPQPDKPRFNNNEAPLRKADKKKFNKMQKKAEDRARRSLEATSIPIREASSNTLFIEDTLTGNSPAEPPTEERTGPAPSAPGEEVEPGDTSTSTWNPDDDPMTPAEPESPQITEPEGLRLLVSSRHLRLASPTFRLMVDGPWLEGGAGGSGTVRRISASEWDAEAFVIVMDIIHGQMLTIPTSVELELLAKMAAIVDYYNCHDVMEPFVDGWIRMLGTKIPSSYGKECVLWMSIAWVFCDAVTLDKMARLAIMGCQGPIVTMELPVPHTLLESIELEREHTAWAILQHVERLSESLYKETNRCPNGCTDVLLGSLARQRREAGIDSSRSSRVLQGRSVNWLQGVISGFDSPRIGRRYNSGSYPNECTCPSLKNRIQPCLKESLDSLAVVKLENIWSGRVKERNARRIGLLAARDAWRSNYAHESY